MTAEDGSAGVVTIGVDMGGTKCAAIALDEQDRVLFQRRVATRGGGDGVVCAIVDVVADLQADLVGAGIGRATGIGVGVPGLVTVQGVLRFAPHIPGVVEFPLRDHLVDAMPGAFVIVENDNTAAAWGEYVAGAGSGQPEMLYVGFGTGIGGGMISGGRLHRGRHGFAGEIGHMVVDRQGPRCVCGRNGCWELLASGTALAHIAGRPGEEVTADALAGDAAALRTLGVIADNIAVGLTDLVLLLDPGCIVLGGGVLDPPDVLLPLIAQSFERSLGEAQGHRPVPLVVAAKHGARSGAIGAALIARSELIRVE